MNLKFISVMLILAMFLLFLPNLMVVAEHTDYTFVGGVSFRDDSKISLALVDGHYIYSPMILTVGSSYDCNYSVYVNGTLYLSGQINITDKAIFDMDIDFSKPGSQEFVVVVGQDNYTYQIDVLMQSYESVVVDQTEPVVEGSVYTYADVLKAYLSSIVGLLVALFLAYIFKVDRIRQEPRRVI